MNQFFEDHNVLQLKYFSSPVTIKKSRYINLKLQKKKVLNPDCFTIEFYQTFKEKITQKLIYSLP